MIDNVVLIMAGAVSGRSLVELKENFHPLGLFDSIENLLVANDLKEIHRLVLVDTPISHYFNACLRSDNLDESRIEFIRNSAHKVYLEDFIDTCTRLQDGSKSVSALLVREFSEPSTVRRGLTRVLSGAALLRSRQEGNEHCSCIARHRNVSKR